MMEHFAILRNVSLSAALILASSVAPMTGATTEASADVPGKAVGNLTSALELTAIRALANAGVEPHVHNRKKVKEHAEKPWEHGDLGGDYQTVERDGNKFCLADERRKEALVDAAPDIYAKVLTYHLTNNSSYASDASERLLELASSSGFGGDLHSGANECILKLAESMPVYIESALLLEGSDHWTDDDRAEFGDWLRDTVYHYTAWASRERKNNWGSAGSAASWAIAHYLSTSDEPLHEKEPDEIELTPEEAMAAHEGMALERMGRTWQGDSRCEKFGIQPGGGIPDELRRGDDGNCELAFLTRDGGSPYTYHAMHVEHLILHGEMLRRHGSNSIFEFTLPEGHNAIKRAILFVIDNPVKPEKSFNWYPHRRGSLYVAHNAIGSTRICKAAQEPSFFRSGRALPYGRLTHPFSCGNGAN